MNKTTIKIDGAKLRSLLESTTGKTIYQITVESGYSKNVISNAIRKGYASSAVQNIARLYGIAPEAYKVKEITPLKSPAQMSIDDIEVIKRSELKDLIKETIKETLNDFVCNEIAGSYDPITRVYTLNIKIK